MRGALISGLFASKLYSYATLKELCLLCESDADCSEEKFLPLHEEIKRWITVLVHLTHMENLVMAEIFEFK
jgi:hypothetical protein